MRRCVLGRSWGVFCSFFSLKRLAFSNWKDFKDGNLRWFIVEIENANTCVVLCSYLEARSPEEGSNGSSGPRTVLLEEWLSIFQLHVLKSRHVFDAPHVLLPGLCSLVCSKHIPNMKSNPCQRGALSRLHWKHFPTKVLSVLTYHHFGVLPFLPKVL